MFSNQAAQWNTALKVHHHSDSDYHTGVPFALSNGGVVELESAGCAVKSRLITGSAQVFLLTSTVFNVILLSVTVVVLVTQRSAPLP